MTSPADPPRGILSGRTYALIVAALSLALLLWWVLENRQLVHSAKVMAGIEQPLAAQDASFYALRVDPVFERYCVSCHGNDKARGDWQANSFHHAMLTGKSSHNIVPGDAEHSQVVERMMLPETDIMAMPPLGHDRPSPDELTVLKMWIDAGASGTAGAEQFADAPPPVKEIVFDKLDMAVVAKRRAPLEADMARLQGRFPFALDYISRDSHGLRVVDSSHVFSDSDFAELQPLLPEVRLLYLQRSGITGASMASLEALQSAERIAMPAAQLTADEMVALVPRLPKLRVLTISAQSSSEELRALVASRQIELFEVE